jgi:citrate lyase beta subunit
MSKINRVLWGATLYVPATSDKISETRSGEDNAGLGSMVICLEDAVRDDEVPTAMENLRKILRQKSDTKVRTYVRPRNDEMLEQLIQHENITNIDGLVLPKSRIENIGKQLAMLSSRGLSAMPTIETVEFWNPVEINNYTKKLALHTDAGHKVDCVRIGGNDLLSTIHARRSRERTLYEGPLGAIMPIIAGAMARHGIPVSSPVFEHYTNDSLLIREIEQDIEHGIMNKTAIHPRQVAVITSGYAVTMSEIADAHGILDSNAKAVFGNEGSMCEPRTHTNWASTILERQKLFGACGSNQNERQAA